MTVAEWVEAQLIDLPTYLPPERAARLARLLGLGGEQG
jgi:hypothetical protein